MTNLRWVSGIAKTVLSLLVVAAAIWMVNLGRELEQLNQENNELNRQIVNLGDINKRLNSQILATTTQLQKVQELERISSELQQRLQTVQKGLPCVDEPVPADVIRMQQPAISSGK
ncbi:DUF2570 domain-containing protein [Yersinia thracica]|uniref:DUF2570 domain-containing protein n=1 Tax=Yersinia thracica TaxID=2890319 RepID=UPI00157BB990|nr:DUF2570 domain-containing protein [Yersinia thracica]